MVGTLNHLFYVELFGVDDNKWSTANVLSGDATVLIDLWAHNWKENKERIKSLWLVTTQTQESSVTQSSLYDWQMSLVFRL